MKADAARNALVEEARELLAEMEGALLQMETGGVGKEAVNAIFRAVHTIKGSAGLFALERIAGFTHLVENLLDHVRSGRLPIDAALISTLLGCSDYIGLLVQAIERGEELHDPDPRQGQTLENALRRRLDDLGVPGVPGRPQAAMRRWHFSVRFHEDVLRHGLDPLALLRHLDRIGTITSLCTLDDALPPTAAMDPETCYLGFEIDFASAAGEAAITGAFEFFHDDGCIVITPDAADPGLPAGCAPPPAAASAAGKSDGLPGAEPKFIRIDVEKLDQLIDLVGELVIAGAGASLIARVKRDQVFKEAAQNIEGLVDQIRAASLSMRMVPISEAFRRFPRLVRDMSQALGKQIELQIEGAETELDKSTVDKIVDPLMHLVRNALDHGIEPAAVRAQAGKAPTGTVRLSASHEAGSIVIEVGDDGCGLDHARIFAKAVASGLAQADRTLSEQEIFQLVFEPGFSTADRVTALSGRGVGMDVVRENVESLHGSVQIRSTPGQGTVVSIRMPLTMAIIAGFQVAVGDNIFVMPLDRVTECMDISGYAISDNTVIVRDRPLALISLATVLGLPPRAARRKNLVVIEYGQQRAGILVDALLGECQAVIKPLGRLFAHVKGLSGSTILGDGRVALILDIPHLMHYLRSTERRQNNRSEAAAV
jgi:two-component system chemotaxis sensor kinase CheA